MAGDSNAIIRIGYPRWLRLVLFRDVAAITLGRRIWVAEGIGGEELQRVLRHERVHVAQMAQLGIVRFLLAYVRQYARHRLRGLPASQAYRRISFEEEAFAAEAEETV